MKFGFGKERPPNEIPTPTQERKHLTRRSAALLGFDELGSWQDYLESKIQGAHEAISALEGSIQNDPDAEDRVSKDEALKEWETHLEFWEGDIGYVSKKINRESI